VKLRTLLELGRTSNLPTVWSNVAAGALLTSAPLSSKPFAVLLLAGSAFYEGGMLLNDAFDAEIDARERPERPIPAGRTSRKVVFQLGFALLGLGMVLLVGAQLGGITVTGYGASAAGLLTVSSVLIYDKWHKGHAWAPIVMGMCRAGLYLMAALAVSGALSRVVLGAALSLLLYIVGLTHIARFETGTIVDRAWLSAFVLSPLVLTAPFLFRTPISLAPLCWALALLWTLRALRIALRGGPGQIPRAVVSLIAGVSLVDATFIAVAGAPFWALGALAAFVLTLRLQRRIRGT
jgi:4-hydroxybenzoate polyprenyltransferase